MKIAHVVPAYQPALRYGGPIISVHSLCQSLVGLGHEVHVFTTAWNVVAPCKVPTNTEIVMDGVKIRYFDVSFWGRRLYYAPALKSYLTSHATDFDLMHIHTSFTWPPWVAAKLARRANIPYVFSPRGMLIEEMINKKSRLLKTAWIQQMDRRNIEYASAIHFTTELERKQTSKLSLCLPRSFVIPNGLDVRIADRATFREQGSPIRPTNTPPRIVFLSRINWKKGLDRLIPTMTHVPNAELLIAGNDNENYAQVLKELAVKHAVEARLKFLGPVYGEHKIELLETADLFVLPSYSENFGNAVLEAMALGCPVIVTPEVGLAEWIKANNAGLVVNGNPKVLGEAINNVLADTNLKNMLSRNAAKLALSEFHPRRIAQQMENQYIKILNNAHSRN